MSRNINKKEIIKDFLQEIDIPFKEKTNLINQLFSITDGWKTIQNIEQEESEESFWELDVTRTCEGRVVELTCFDSISKRGEPVRKIKMRAEAFQDLINMLSSWKKKYQIN